MTMKQQKREHLITHFWNMHELFNTLTGTHRNKRKEKERVRTQTKLLRIGLSLEK